MAQAPPRECTIPTRAHARRLVRARVAAVSALCFAAWWAQQASAMAPLPAPAPAADGALASAPGWGDLLRMGLSLAVVVGLIVAAWWWMRRTGLGAPSPGGAFEIISRHPVGRGQQVVVARFGPRVLCLQQTREGLRTLCELTDAADVAAVLGQVGSARTRLPSRRGVIRTIDLREKAAS